MMTAQAAQPLYMREHFRHRRRKGDTATNGIVAAVVVGVEAAVAVNRTMTAADNVTETFSDSPFPLPERSRIGAYTARYNLVGT